MSDDSARNEKPSSPYYVMLYFWWGCRGILKLITLRSERVNMNKTTAVCVTSDICIKLYLAHLCEKKKHGANPPCSVKQITAICLSENPVWFCPDQWESFSAGRVWLDLLSYQNHECSCWTSPGLEWMSCIWFSQWKVYSNKWTGNLFYNLKFTTSHTLQKRLIDPSKNV